MNTLNQTPEHLPAEELAAFALGKELANAETIAEHIANCSRCETLVAKTPRDTFLGILNKAKPGQSLTGPQIPKTNSSTTEELPEELRRQTKYTFLKQLGGGGMGVVYLAEHNLMKRKVAVKLIPPELIGNPAVRERFLREVVSAAALEHPNVVRAYSAEEFGQHMLFEMEFVDGLDLGQVVKNKGPLPVVFAVNYIRQAAQALQHGMLKSLVHRDIKPGNLMLTRAGSVKVADFGLAKFSRETDKVRDRSLTGMNAMMGTPDYMAPEQARNAKSADIRADIYSLGCTFYYLLTGQPPFAGESVTDLIFKHWEALRPHVGLLREDVPDELSLYIQRMMAKEPGDRPQTPKEVVDWLTKFAKELTNKETVEKPKEKKAAAVKNKVDVIWKFDEFMPEFTPEPATPKSVMKQKEIKRKKKWPMIAGAIACVLVGFAIMAAAGVFRVKTKDGTIVLENLPADAEVTVDGGTATVTSDGKTFEICVAADKKHRLEVKKDGFKMFGSEVEVDTGGRKSIVVRLEPIKTPDLAKLPKGTRKKEVEESTPSVPESPAVPPIKNETDNKKNVPEVVNNEPPKPLPPLEAPKQADPKPHQTKGDAEDFLPLFNGKDLTGWVADGDCAQAEWKTDASGIAIAGGPISTWGFLLSTREYTDFVLRLQFQQMTEGAKSGIVIRGVPGSRINGLPYQCKVNLKDPESTGAVLWADDARTYQLPIRPAKLKPAGEWNDAEVDLRGQSLRVTINGDCVQNMDLDAFADRPRALKMLKEASGRIGLQKHEGNVRFRNIEIKELVLEKGDANSFVPLFNGTDLTGWSVDSGAADRWKVESNYIKTNGGGSAHRGWILTDKDFGNFVMNLEFRAAPEADGAVGIRARPGDQIGGVPHHLAIKITGYSDPAKPQIGALYYWPNTWLQPNKQSRVLSNGEWNKMTVRLQGEELRISVNGGEVQKLSLGEFAKKANVFPGAKRLSGCIGLQQHTGEIRFRNIEIKELPEMKNNAPVKKGPPADPFKANSVWADGMRTLTVLERKGEMFRARFVIGTSIDREVTGTIKDGKVSWLGRDVRPIKGGPGGDNQATITKDAVGDLLDFTWRDNNGSSGTFMLRLRTGK